MTPPRLADQAARDRIEGRVGGAGLGDNLFVEAGAGSGKTHSLVARVVALVDQGVELRHVAAITFTEKAAAELRDRIRAAFEARLRAAAGSGDERAAARYRAALDDVDGAAISTLHAFAQRILTEHPIEAGLPPNVEVLDEVASQVEFEERWRDFRGSLLDDPDLERTLLLLFAAGVRFEDLRAVAEAFGDNWDLAADPVRIPWLPDEPPEVAAAPLVEAIVDLRAERDACLDAGDRLYAYLDDGGELAEYADQLDRAPDEYERLRLLRQSTPTFRVGNRGRGKNWRCDIKDLQERIRRLADVRAGIVAGASERLLQRIAVAIRGFTLAAVAARRRQGRLEFHDLLVMARELLRGPNGWAVRGALRARYRHLLLDEFQDTDPIQVELAVLIASPDPSAGGRPWHETPVDRGRLFVVGDPKQSIYRFRRADIALFLRAREVLGDPPVELTTNFRSSPPVIDWVNHVFGALIRHEEGAQPAYLPLGPAPGRTAPLAGPPVVLLGSAPHADRLGADELREREAADVAATIEAIQAERWQVADHGRDPAGWRDATLGDVAVLLPARTSLPALERALEERGIPYRAETSSLVYSTREVRDTIASLRAVADPTDALALTAALRSAVFGCGDDDLVAFHRGFGGRWNVLAPLPADLPDDHPVGSAIRVLRALHDDVPWSTPSELLDRLIRARRLFELGYAHGRPRDLWRRLRFVVDQARQWSEAERGTLREYLEWARMQASESTRVAETVLPETDDDSVRILTVHGAKGLEFPIAIVSGLSTRPGGVRRGVEVLWPPQGEVALKLRQLASPAFEAFRPLDEQLSHHERLRLLYVACTRAEDHLVVSLHRLDRDAGSDEHKRTSAELLAGACRDAPHQVDLEPVAAPAPARDAVPPAPDALPPFDAWQREREAALARGARRHSIGASDVGRLPLPGGDPGLDKAARDLDLPPWLKGRYGTAIGRAVHAVLQTVDLATGAGLDETVAAQAAAEGVLGREADIRALAAAALGAPTVRAAVARDHWRETYVAARVGDVTLEGYLDLVYREDGGLVVVDYKTAGSDDRLDARLDHYRLQGGAYALAVSAAVGLPVHRVVFVFLTPSGAVERVLDDLDAAVAEVRARLAGAA